MLRSLLAIALVLAAVGLPAMPAAAGQAAPFAPGLSPALCTNGVGPSVAPPPNPVIGRPGAHATFYGQSGYPVLCAGAASVATVAFLNSGAVGWYGNAFLGTWGPEPGQDKVSALGGDGSAGTPATGWPRANRIARQPTAYVGPGQVAWFQFTVQAPVTPGIYRLGLRPVLEGQQWLEDYGVFWYVTVKADDDHVPQLPAPAVPPPPPPPPPRTYAPAVLADGTRQIRVPSLMYHYVSWLPATDPNMTLRRSLTVSPTDFEEQLRYLRDQGYNGITTRDLWWSLDQTAPLPAKPVMLTFDDGYADAYSVVLPLLKKYSFVGVFFVTVNRVGTAGYLTRDQVRELADAGMDVESHAMDHVSMNTSAATQRYQMCTARQYLSDWTGTDVRHFAYPSGDYNADSFPALQSCGYLSAYKKMGGSVQSSANMDLLQRARVVGQLGLGALLTALQQ